jgi:hypothetical protein
VSTAIDTESRVGRVGGDENYSMDKFATAETAGVSEESLSNPKVIAKAKKLWKEQGTESPYFKRWFGDSKVVDGGGEPQVLFHQTQNDFDVFDPRRAGAGQFDNETPFGIFLKPDDKDIGLPGKKQMALYARITNPLRVTDRLALRQYLEDKVKGYAELRRQYESVDKDYQKQFDDLSARLDSRFEEWERKHPDAGPDARGSALEKANEELGYDALMDAWKGAGNKLSAQMKEAVDRHFANSGFDGVILEKDVGGFGKKTTKTIIAFKPEQVKSATGNRGTFDSGNPNINYSKDRFAEGEGGKYIKGKGERFMSIKTDSDGNQYVDVDLTSDIQKTLQAAGSMSEKRHIIYRYIMDNLRGKYPTNDGREVNVVKTSAKELKHSVHENSIRVIPELAAIIKAGKRTDIKEVKHKIFSKFAYYDVDLKVGNEYYTANINIGIKEDGESVLYQINQFREKAATFNVGGVQNPVTVKGPVINNNITDSGAKSKGKNKNLSDGTYAPGATPADGFSGLPKIEQPELVEIAKSLLGGIAPKIKWALKRGANGLEYRDKDGNAHILLKADLFKDPEQAVKTLAHELGHADHVDGEKGHVGEAIQNLKDGMASIMKKPTPGESLDVATIHDELYELSKKWRPFDESTATQRDIAYRKKPEEVYADAVSALLTDPDALAKGAPTAFAAIMGGMKNKPEFYRPYQEIISRYAEGGKAVVAHRHESLSAGMDAAQARKNAASICSTSAWPRVPSRAPRCEAYMVSQTSFRLNAWVRLANIIETTWLHGENVRACLSIPNLVANDVPKYAGIFDIT